MQLKSIIAVAVCLGAASAVAATTTDSAPVHVASDAQNLGGYDIDGFEPATLTVFHLHVAATATWSGNLNESITFDPNDVRQGAALSVGRDASPTGAVHVGWTLTGTLRPLDAFDVDVGTIPISADAVSCSPKLSGGGYSCNATSAGFTLAETPCIPLAPWVDIVLEVNFDIDPAAATATRSFTIGGDSALADASLTFNGSSQSEVIPVACNKPAGDSVNYVISNVHWAPDTKATQQPHFKIGTQDPGYAFGCSRLPALFDAPFGDPLVTHPAFDLAGSGHTTDMGSLKANNVSPTIDPIGSFSGVEGSPVTFGATIHSQCPIGGYVWQFSDGTMSFGPHPQRSFGQDGVLNGQLNVTDITNLSASGDFDVDIDNAPPVPNAGPATSGAWGRLIPFHGQAVDPGSGDQPLLSYRWDWGDGTPGTGGADALHAWRVPGDYVATLTVCDDHVCVNSGTNVHIRKRVVSMGYTGANSGAYSGTATAGASVDDEFGEPVNAASVSFKQGSNALGAGQTDSAGNVQVPFDVSMPAGSYTIEADYGGSALYNAAVAFGAFSVVPMSSAIVYTGALNGGPNKAVALSARLTDGLGRALAGKTVVFNLGAQTASAVTDANGNAATSLTLNQKNGSYLLTATWSPSGGDTSRWVGSSASATFTAGTKK